MICLISLDEIPMLRGKISVPGAKCLKTTPLNDYPKNGQYTSAVVQISGTTVMQYITSRSINRGTIRNYILRITCKYFCSHKTHRTQRRTSSHVEQVQTEGHAYPHPHTCLGLSYIERPVQNVRKLMTQILHSPANWSRQTVKTGKYVFWRGESDEVGCSFLTAIVLFPDQLWNGWQMETLYFNMRTYKYPPHPHTHGSHEKFPTHSHIHQGQGLQWWEMRVSCLFGKVWDGRALSDVQGQTGLSIPSSMWNGETAVCVCVCVLGPALNWCHWKNKANQSKTTEI